MWRSPASLPDLYKRPRERYLPLGQYALRIVETLNRRHVMLSVEYPGKGLLVSDDSEGNVLRDIVTRAGWKAQEQRQECPDTGFMRPCFMLDEVKFDDVYNALVKQPEVHEAQSAMLDRVSEGVNSVVEVSGDAITDESRTQFIGRIMNAIMKHDTATMPQKVNNEIDGFVRRWRLPEGQAAALVRGVAEAVLYLQVDGVSTPPVKKGR